jgi:threonine/homoserine/homoserine lactone efflux protein
MIRSRAAFGFRRSLLTTLGLATALVVHELSIRLGIRPQAIGSTDQG